MNESLKNKKLALFFTYPVSLELWEKLGILSREIKLYRRLGEKLGKIYFITYGTADGRFAEMLARYNITVLPKKYRLPNFIYSFLIPWFYRRELIGCDFFKTNQMAGSWSAVLSKIIFSKKLIVRTGYPLSLNAGKESAVKFVLSKIIEKIALVFASTMVVATQYELEYYGFNPKIKVIPNYVDTEEFRPLSAEHSFNDITTLLFIGRLSPEKNLLSLFSALAGMDIRLQIIGSGALETELKALAETEKLMVEFLGNREHEILPEFINRANIFVLPSLYEGNPKVLLEAMACGAVVVGTAVRGISNIIKDGENGFLSGTAAAELKLKIAQIIGMKDEPVLKDIRARAREFILENYSLDKILEWELKNYENSN